MKKLKPAKKIEAISACFNQVKESMNTVIDNQKPWLNVQGVGPIQVKVSDSNVLIGLKGGTWPYQATGSSGGGGLSEEDYPFRVSGSISGSIQAVLNITPGTIKNRYIPTIYPTAISMASRPDIIVTGITGSVWVGVTFDALKQPTSVYLDGGPTVPTQSTSLGVLPIADWFRVGSGPSASFGPINQYTQTSMTYFWCGTELLWSRT